MKRNFLAWLNRLADKPPRTTTIMVAGRGGAGVSIDVLQMPPGIWQELARWLLGR